ncbi:MarR family winged helix-turn-helix transcriptional regulator [Nonomuraea rhizosphaerae]|uniref:MarR family winged helix-turn-helix transcriptional regulator n=1 Tax=Nonomuraea rhizosphaerae TaxID=2665663 RepID=UPI001C5FA6C7|nr:MarR family winged helix-turn-helix transcriptional regulator [Nonomuraea rhizosphaerae]
MATPPVTGPPIRRSAPLLDHLGRLMRLRGESVLAPLGLRPRHLVTLTMLREGGDCTQQALATRLAMDGTNLVGLLNELESLDLIERKRSPEDRRRHVVAMTAVGAELLTKAELALTAVEDEILAALDAGQRETLYALLQLATSKLCPPSPCGEC